MSDYKRLGDYIVSARQQSGLSRTNLATAAQISTRTLADIENGELGKRKSFSASTMEAISLCIGWRPGDWRRVLNGEEPKASRRHEAIYRGEPTTIYESGCWCGMKFTGPTPYDANERLDTHLHKHEDTSGEPR